MPQQSNAIRRSLGHADLKILANGIGGEFRISDNRKLTHDQLHRGRLAHAELAPGLSVHTVDVLDLADFSADIAMPPSISFSFVLGGEVSMLVGDDEKVSIGPDANNGQPQGAFLALQRPEHFKRFARQGCHLRAAIVVLTAEWLTRYAEDGLGASAAYARLSQQPVSHGAWSLTARQIALAEQILRPPQFEPLLHTLFLTSRAIEASAEALRSIAGIKPNEAYSLRRRDLDRLEALKHFIESDEAVGVPIDEIASRFGVSIRSLQRDFRLAFGTTIYSYVKDLRLNRARDALQYHGVTIAEAAHIAGYASAANFSTAFRKVFGVAPGRLRLD
ncbi:helix-turn-helix transcriptional regulator [Bosea lathyri]|uniref:AraC-type DNA-binding protein n=1 Tax=Bosea lathyri TaxID=1036778 RepID=A0A1H5ZI33_9HYPH|nr:AraC family transcriptional regulator [Bosea lathyri]SEG36128.1 AraC-type DNA-binding protein [Bosea lathyri]